MELLSDRPCGVAHHETVLTHRSVWNCMSVYTVSRPYMNSICPYTRVFRCKCVGRPFSIPLTHIHRVCNVSRPCCSACFRVLAYTTRSIACPRVERVQLRKGSSAYFPSVLLLTAPLLYSTPFRMAAYCMTQKLAETSSCLFEVHTTRDLLLLCPTKTPLPREYGLERELQCLDVNMRK